jgi:hypothetical protein
MMNSSGFTMKLLCLLMRQNSSFHGIGKLHQRLSLECTKSLIRSSFRKFHSWFTWQFEKALQQFTGKCMYIPYWDSEKDSERESESHIFHEETFGTWAGFRLQDGRQCTADGIASSFGTPFESSMSENGIMCLERLFLPGFAFSGEAEILAMITNYDQYADDIPGEDTEMNGFRVDFEAGPHMLVHGIVGGHMHTHYSAADPLFYLHHSNVDRLYSMWQDYHGHDELEKEDYMHPWQYDGNLDQTMAFEASGQISHDFMMEYEDGTLGYPTVREVLSLDSSVLSVRYMNDRLATMIPDYQPNHRLFQSAESNDNLVRCNRNRRREMNEQDGTGEELTGLQQNMLRGQLTIKDEYIESTTSICQRRNTFTLQEDREDWDQLCLETPENITVAERFALMAERNCKRRGYPRKDQIHAQMKMSHKTKPEAFECFHRPDKTQL